MMIIDISKMVLMVITKIYEIILIILMIIIQHFLDAIDDNQENFIGVFDDLDNIFFLLQTGGNAGCDTGQGS